MRTIRPSSLSVTAIWHDRRTPGVSSPLVSIIGTSMSVTSPVTPRGMWIYGALMGLLTILIRNLGGLAEGVMYAILLGNSLSPLIDRLTPPRPYGARKAGAQ